MNHLEAIRGRLADYGLDAMLILSPPGERYAVDFYGEGIVLVTGKECYYVTDPRYLEAARQQVTGAQVLGTSAGQDRKKILGRLVDSCGIHVLGFEEGYVTVSQHQSYEGALSCRLAPAQGLLNGLRAAKGREEIARMEQAQRIAEATLEEILGFLRPGLTEQEVAARLVYEMMKRGAERTSFDPIVASGPNSSRPHHVPGDRKLERGDFVTLDFGCVWKGYCSDMTRTVVLGGATEEMKKVYDTVLEAQQAGIAAARSGIPGKEIDRAARRVIEQAGYGAYFGHSFGHGVGLEIHEGPNASGGEETLMPEGAVISAEPGIYLPGRFGVRIEDVLVLTPAGAVNLTKAPKELIIL